MKGDDFYILVVIHFYNFVLFHNLIRVVDVSMQANCSLVIIVDFLRPAATLQQRTRVVFHFVDLYFNDLLTETTKAYVQ